MEQINLEVEELEYEIRKKLNEFDDGKKNKNSKFSVIYQNIIDLWLQKKELIKNIEQKIIDLENNDLIKLNQINNFNNNKLNNACFLKEYSELVNKLEKIHFSLKDTIKYDQLKEYDKFMQEIDLIDLKIKELNEELEKNCYTFNNKMYDVLSKEINCILKKMSLDKDNLKNKVRYDLKLIWEKNIKINNEDNKIKDEFDLKFICEFRNSLNNTDDYFNALNKNFLLEQLTNSLGKNLVEKLIKIILSKEYCLDDFEIIKNENIDILKIKLLKRSIDNYNGELIIQCISTLIRFLTMIFNENNLVLLFFNSTFSQIFQILNDNLLNQFLPSKENDSLIYTSYIKKIEDLQNQAIESNCLFEKDALNFKNTIDSNFINKLCYGYLVKARSIIKKDLFPFQDIGNNYLDKNKLNDSLDIEQTLFSFPKCQISCSVFEFVNLLKEIIKELNQKNENCKEIFLTARKICEIYLDISTIKHEKQISEETIYSAIFHNNCFYLAHELIKLNYEINFDNNFQVILNEKINEISDLKKLENIPINENKLQSKSINENLEKINDLDTESGWDIEEDIVFQEDENNENTLIEMNKEIENTENCSNIFYSFIDFIPMLRHLGSEYLLIVFRKHKKTILDYLNDLNLIKNILNDKTIYKSDHSDHPFHKALNQSLIEIFKIRDDYLDILPKSVTQKLTCTLLNTFIEEIIHKVLNLEDITEKQCDIILTSFNFIEKYLDNIQEILKTNLEISNYFKLLELKFVLKANLNELNERWNDGNGPLAEAFKPEQLKHLIRALFQNTERRASLLYKIK